MTHQERIKSLLEKNPACRELKNLWRFLAKVIKQERGLDISEELLADILKDSDAYNRACRKVKRDYEELRGTDWENGKRLSEQKQIDLGYIPGFEETMKKLDAITIIKK